MRSVFVVILCGLGGPLATGWVSVQSPCDFFVTTLQAIPHTELSQRTGTIESLWNGVAYRGCEVHFSTRDSLSAGVAVPDFYPLRSTEMARIGWNVVDTIVADGAGSGVHGVERNALVCLIRWSQPSYLDDEGAFVQSDTLTMTIQCFRPTGDD